MIARLQLPVLLLCCGLAGVAKAEDVDAGTARLCQLYEARSASAWPRFQRALRDLGENAARSQLALWQDELFVQQNCGPVAPADAERLCALGRHLLGPQRSFLAAQSWRRSSTEEEASLILELGDQVDQACGAPVMAVQGVLQQLAGSPQGVPLLQQPSVLGFNAQGWLFSSKKGTSSSTRK